MYSKITASLPSTSLLTLRPATKNTSNFLKMTEMSIDWQEMYVGWLILAEVSGLF